MFPRPLLFACCLLLPLAAAAAAPGLRLGDAATPRAYRAHLVIDPARADFDGEVAIDVTLNRDLDVLWLNAVQVDIAAAELRREGQAPLPLRVVPGNEDVTGLAAMSTATAAPAPLAAGPATVVIRYRGRIEPLSTRGVFKQQEGSDWYVVTQFEALSARRAFPCFDEPGWKTPWQLTLDVPAAHAAVSNTPETSSTPIENGMKRVVFAATQALPSYLVAFAVGPFDVVDGGTAGRNRVALRYFAPRGRGGELRYVRESTPKLLEILEDYFGTPYPFEKLDSVTIPQTVNFGAMENAGMITYAGRLMLATPAEETTAFKRAYAAIAAHEIAHQWFGNLVTMQWWDDLWLNEAFATWMGSKAAFMLTPSWDDGHSRARSRARAVQVDRLASTRRVQNPVVAKGDVGAAFDSITYQKGFQVLAMFERAIGETAFRDGVRAYLAKHARGSATSADFMAALAGAAGPGNTLAADFAGFIRQPGLPLVDVTLDCRTAPVLSLVSKRLRPVGSKAPAEGEWNTPACFTLSERGQVRSVCAPVPAGSSRLALGKACPDWVLANSGGVGYYVARYDDKLFARNAAAGARLPAAEAVAQLADAGLMVESGLLPVGAALTLADGAGAHASPVVRQAAAELLRGLRRDWFNRAEENRFQRIVKTRFLPEAKRLGWRARAGEDEKIAALRAVLLPLAADEGADAMLRREARALAAGWLTAPSSLEAASVEPVLGIAGAFADDAFLRDMTRALPALRREERARLLKALGAVRDPALQARALSLALDPALGGRDALALVDHALEDNATRVTAFGFLRKHYDALTARIPQDTATNFIATLGRACSAGQRDAFREFFGTRSAGLTGGPRRYAQALERIELCVAAREAPSISKGVAQVTPLR